jgi:hypothetical protein
MAAPLGAVVGIFYDARVDLEPGDAIVTGTGRTYLVMTARQQRRGRHVGRWHLRCLIQPAPPEGARVYTLRWYRRRRRAPVET